ncbi:MAG: hemerythrin domain-containing protein [Candidatus Kariarchaeaceae archaeon]
MSNNNRFDVFYFPHKAIRNFLSQLQFRAGRLDFSDDENLAAFEEELQFAWKGLHYHAEGEEKFVFPHLEKANKSVYDTLEKEHDKMHPMMDSIENNIAAIRGLNDEERNAKGVSFNQSLNDFIAHYLMHLQNEELKAMPELWKVHNDDELLGMQMKIPTITPPNISAFFLKYLFPALNPEERINYLKLIHSKVPEQVYSNFRSIAEMSLESTDWEKLNSQIPSN